MGTISKFGPSAVLAVAGVKASEMLNVTNPIYKIGAAVAGALAGLVIASKLGKTAA